LRDHIQRAVDTRQKITLEFFPGRRGAAAARVGDHINGKVPKHMAVDSVELAQPPLAA
jgi:hypothetical protein